MVLKHFSNSIQNSKIAEKEIVFPLYELIYLHPQVSIFIFIKHQTTIMFNNLAARG